ncbi:hypothetical protein C8Q75DRAFT_741281 [Abortiporus biennis]|nr:hypothetical protein C8Q75DRAFT_741281 [Abortiporus biennis]
MPLSLPFSSKKDPNMSKDPQIRQIEQMIANEARSDQKNLEHAIKDVKAGESTHNKSVKAAQKAEHNLDKAVKNEHDAAKVLNKANHDHEAAIANQQSAERDLALKQQHETRLVQDVEKKRSNMDSIQHRKESNDQQRELKLSEIHAQAASRAGTLNSTSSDDHPQTELNTVSAGAVA